MVAAKIYQGLNQEAIAVLLHFFKREFADQIAASGEQPFEAIRTRPYHYRCFNLEALIVSSCIVIGIDLTVPVDKREARGPARARPMVLHVKVRRNDTDRDGLCHCLES